MHVLLIEDDKRMSEYIVKGLTQGGHHVDAVTDGREGLTLALQSSHDVAIVDRMLPSLDGLDVVRAMRTSGLKTPVLFLSALGEVGDRVAGLEAGADDYLGKPFAFSELSARVTALGRRQPINQETTVLRVHDLELDLVRRIALRSGDKIELLPREFALLEVLMRNAGRVVTRIMLLEHVWGYQFEPQSSLIETHISRLRHKIDEPYATPLLHTVRNMGYSLYEPN